jgi:hypothetical protein
MKKFSFVSVLRVLTGAAFLCALAAFAQLPPPAATPGPVPPALFNAKTIFVSNAGADSGLFPEPFSGDPSRPYTQLVSRLLAIHAFTLVPDPSAADLVLELQLTAPNGPSRGSKQLGAADPVPMFRLVVYDRRSHYILWTETQSIEVAFMQKTHDRNFDQALEAVLGRFLQVCGKTLSSPPPAQSGQ